MATSLQKNLLARPWRLAAAGAAVLGLVLLVLARGGTSGAAGDGAYETALVDRGPVTQTVATSGSVRPLVTVQVGSQLSGQVKDLFADFNSEVTAGQLIARIDPQTFRTRVEAARADRDVAAATLSVRKAEIDRARALLAQRKSDLDRLAGLGPEGGVAEIEVDAARAQFQAAKADLAAARAQQVNAEALVAQRAAALEQAEVDLERTEIRSPINGVVIKRSVDVGQTVAASLQAPVLFEIAQDLSHIQIEADVNEADIGVVAQGNPVSFTVDAYPDRKFTGRVETVRLAPTELQNVVTYTVVIHADNPGKILFPGMTATVEIITGARQNALRVPNAAARFLPSGVEAPAAQGNGGGPGGQSGGGRMDELAETLDLSDAQRNDLQSRMRELFAGARTQSGQPGLNPGERRKRFEAVLKSVLNNEQWEQYQSMQRAGVRFGTVWVLTEADKLEPRRVRLGLSDGTYTEILDGDLAEGDPVVLRENRAAS